MGMSPDADMDESYAEFESRKRNEEIDAFATENEIDSTYLKNVISEYEFSGNMDRDGIRAQIQKPLLVARKLIEKITSFISENCDKYQ